MFTLALVYRQSKIQYLGLVRLDGVDGIATLDVEEQAVMLVDLGDGNDIFKTLRTTTPHHLDKPMKPAGNLMSVRTLPSTWTLRSLRMSMACEGLVLV